MSFTVGTPHKTPFGNSDAYLLLVNVDVATSQSLWNGRTIEVTASAETTSAISEILVSGRGAVV